MDLRNKGIVITGASSGLGLALAKRLIKAGAKVVGVSRNPEKLKKLYGDKVYTIACDISKQNELDAMLEEAEGFLGGIDIFVANAGFAYYGPIGSPDWQSIERIYATNVISPLYTLQKLTTNRVEPLTFMVTISALGKMVLPGFAFYNSTKFALDAFVRTYRMERPGTVKIIPVYPVATKTAFFRKAGGDDTPVPFPRQTADYVAFCMEWGLRLGMRSIYPSFIFIIRCILVRVLPIDLLVQAVEWLRFKAWRKRHQI